MVIAVIGYYGRQNVGDERIFACLKAAFEGHTLIPYETWDAIREIDTINEYDFALYGGGGLVLPRFFATKPLFDLLKIPFGCVGLGAEYITRNSRPCVATMLQKARFVMVRDRESQHLLGDHYKTFVGPDLTYLQPFEVAPAKGEAIGLNVRPWINWGGAVMDLRRSMAEWCDLHNLAVSGLLAPPAHGEDGFVRRLKSLGRSIVPVAFSFNNRDGSDAELLARYFAEVPKSFTIDSYQDFRCLVGMRFHSLIFAIQCGVPFIALSYQPKCQRLLNELGPDFADCFLTLKQSKQGIGKAVAFVERNHDRIRERLLEIRERNVSYAQNVMQRVRELVERYDNSCEVD